jgi:hypothetical protein
MSDMQNLATHNEDWVGLPDKYLPQMEHTPDFVFILQIIG